MARILLVEDEVQMAEPLASSLREEGFDVSLAANGKIGLSMAAGHELLIVDVMMPSMDGFEMVRRIRALGHTMPVIFLTAKDAVDSRVQGLELGDDYLVKPFYLEELLARVRLRLRHALRSADTLTYADLTVDVRARSASRGGHPIYLSNTEFLLLELLLREPGRPVPKRVILREVWNDAGTYSPNVVEVYIGYLRNKLEAHGGTRLIRTVKNVGYMVAGGADDA